MWWPMSIRFCCGGPTRRRWVRIGSREVEVRVLRDNVKVRHRAGYADYSPEQLASLEAAAHRFFDRPDFLRHQR